MTDPTPAQLGPYRILDVLGEGGMGLVYRAEHRGTGEPAAIKVALRTAGEHLASIRREIHALRRVQHPGIVRILDDGIADGLPWYAMPLLQGRTLEQHLQALHARSTGRKPSSAPEDDRTEPLLGPPAAAPSPAAQRSAWYRAAPLAPLLTLLRRVCAPLAFLHGAGLVHRDLKPANIFLQQDSAGTDRPVLVDLGIAVPFSGASGREELGIEEALGTRGYMAPEQIRGELVDARADLYALGCILYKCATGRLPFEDPNLRAILDEPPPPPSLFAPGLPMPLDRLILQLLAKRPQDRPGHAADIASELVALGAQAEPDQGPPPRAYLYRPELQGRAHALSKLKSTIRRATVRPSGSLMLLAGESGVGKTRLAMEAAQLADRQGLQVITGRCEPLGQACAEAAIAPPLQPFRPALLAAADRAREGGRAAVDRLIGPRGRVLAPYEPSLLALPGQDEQPPPASLPPEAARARVIHAVAETLRALAEPTPLLLVLDDLQWADELSLGALDALARAGLQDRSLLVLGTYRLDEVTPELAALAGTPGASVLPLERLDTPDLRAMVSDMLGLRDPAPWPVLEALFQHSRGNPFFVAEYLRAAIGEGLLGRDSSGAWQFHVPSSAVAALSSLPLPTTLAELIERRLAALDGEARTLAAWAAVLGQDLDSDLLLLGMDGMDSARAADALDTLRERQILESAPDGRLRFVHDKIREIAYRGLPEDRRMEWHRRAGEAIEAQAAGAPDRWAAIGHHMARGGMHLKAGRSLARAAARAREVYANAEAIRLYRAALDELDHAAPGEVAPDELATIHEGLGDVLGVVGNHADARNAYTAALERASRLTPLDVARLHRKRGRTWEVLHHYDEALDGYTAAEAALTTEGDPADRPGAWWNEWVQIQIDRVSVHYWLAEVDRIRERIDVVRPVVEQHGTPIQRAHFFQALAQLSVRRERYAASAETVQWTRACAEAFEDAGVKDEIVRTRCMLGTALLLNDELEEAEEVMREALDAAQRIGDLRIEARYLPYMTMIQRRLRRVPVVERFAERSREAAIAAQMAEYTGAALANLAWVAMERGETEEAERNAREAIARWDSVSLVYPFQWLARLPLARIALGRGDVREAVEQARTMLDERQQRLPDKLTAALQAAVDEFAAGRVAAARRALRGALRIAAKLGFG